MTFSTRSLSFAPVSVLVHEVVQPAPDGLQLLEVLVVEDLVELLGEQLVDLGDLGLDHGDRVGADHHLLGLDEVGEEHRQRLLFVSFCWVSSGISPLIC